MSFYLSTPMTLPESSVRKRPLLLSRITQATTLAVAAAGIGIPVGVAAGHWLWIVYAHGLGIAAAAALHTTTFVALAAAAVIVANVIALVPGALAARIPPAGVLRTE